MIIPTLVISVSTGDLQQVSHGSIRLAEQSFTSQFFFLVQLGLELGAQTLSPFLGEGFFSK
jgi:hypothetical protein